MIPVFFTPEAVSRPKSSSPSGYKPQQVVDAWTKKYAGDARVLRHDAISGELLCRTHSPKYVRDVLALKEPNGFGTTDKAVARSCLFTCGGVLAAAQHVLTDDTSM